MNTNAATIHQPVADLAAGRRRIMWELPVLNQRADACVGYAFASAAGAPESAERIYAIAKTLDRWPGVDYYGTTVTAGAEASKALGIIESYEWVFGVAGVLDALAAGPVVLGAHWTPGMLKPAAGISMSVDAPKHRSYAHCAVVVGYDPLDHEVCIQSSWGTAWGTAGRAWLPVADLATLMGRTGEACLVVPA